MTNKKEITRIRPNEFEQGNHWYPRALNAQLHPLVASFLQLSQRRILTRYCHLNPSVNREKLEELLNYKPKHILFAGADLIHVTSAKGIRKMAVIETNSCPSGQKSMPLLDENNEQGGYKRIMENTFLPMLKRNRRMKPSSGALAVLYDKNPMEASGYAHAMADLMKEEVLMVPYFRDSYREFADFEDKKLVVYENGKKIPIRAAFRYVTQAPWTRLPSETSTPIMNPVTACLAGGRNKLVAAKAYNLMNAELQGSGLSIFTPETIWNVSKNEVPIWVRKMGGHAVVKDPYSNAGQGVFTILSQKELDDFMNGEYAYDQFIVQSLIGNYNWSSNSSSGKLYHVGTIPNKKDATFATDLRMMIHSTPEGLRTAAIYARRAKAPLTEELDSAQASWDMLGTNLSVKRDDGGWDSESSRLIMMDRKDFRMLGLGMDELIEGYIQTCLSLIAIDKMGEQITTSKGRLRAKLYSSLIEDDALMNEIEL